MRRNQFKIWPVVLTVILIGAVAFESTTRPQAADAEPYHKMLSDMFVNGTIPKYLGEWVGEQGKPDEAAIKLLNPNVLVKMTYHHQVNGKVVTLLLVQCKDARDIYGHFPPICYPNNGFPMKLDINNKPIMHNLKMKVSDKVIPVKRYFFKTKDGAGDMVIDNFIIYPPRKVRTKGTDEWEIEEGEYHLDMDHFSELVGDYTRRFFGGSQVQIIYGNNTHPEEYEDLFVQIAGGALPFIESIRCGVKMQ